MALPHVLELSYDIMTCLGYWSVKKIDACHFWVKTFKGKYAVQHFPFLPALITTDMPHGGGPFSLGSCERTTWSRDSHWPLMSQWCEPLLLCAPDTWGLLATVALSCYQAHPYRQIQDKVSHTLRYHGVSCAFMALISNPGLLVLWGKRLMASSSLSHCLAEYQLFGGYQSCFLNEWFRNMTV